MYAIIACGVFRKEVEKLREALGFPFDVHYLGSGLHVDFDELEEALKAALERCKGYEGIIVLYGECHPRIHEIIAPYRAALLDCQNCVDAFITRKGMEEKSSRGLYFFLSPGWIEDWRPVFDKMGWSQEEARLQLGPFKGAVFMDTLGDAKEREEQLIEFLDFTLLPYEVMPADLSHFKSLIIEARKRLEKLEKPDEPKEPVEVSKSEEP